MPKRDVIVNLPGFAIKKVEGYDPVILEVNYRRKASCIYCNHKKLRKKSSFVRHVRHETVGLRRTLLKIKAYKFYCSKCCRYFNQRFPGIGKYQRATERLHEQVFHDHTEGVSQKSLSRKFCLGKATIERWYHQGYLRKQTNQHQPLCPEVLGIDEHFFSKRDGYATTLCNLRKHKIFDVVKGRSAQSLHEYLSQLKGKERVRVVCMDLSPSYRQLIKKHFPQAKIVADRFHVIRLINQMCMQTYQSIDVKMRYQRGLLGVLRSNPENLTEKKKQRRDEYLKQQPVIAALYEFKQRLHKLLMKKHCTAKKCRRLLPIFLKMLKQLKQNPFKPLQTLVKTLHNWREEIVRMWRFTKNNGITEGFHRKMKLIQRRAYGFRNFENYRLRVRVLCS